MSCLWVNQFLGKFTHFFLSPFWKHCATHTESNAQFLVYIACISLMSYHQTAQMSNWVRSLPFCAVTRASTRSGDHLWGPVYSYIPLAPEKAGAIDNKLALPFLSFPPKPNPSCLTAWQTQLPFWSQSCYDIHPDPSSKYKLVWPNHQGEGWRGWWLFAEIKGVCAIKVTHVYIYLFFCRIYILLSVCDLFSLLLNHFTGLFSCPNYITISFEARPTSNYLLLPILHNLFSAQLSRQVLGSVCWLIILVLSGGGSGQSSGARPCGQILALPPLGHMN